MAVARIFIYGVPRSSNVRGCIDRKFKYPIQVRHAGDPVPTVPPLTFRYVDYPLELNTDGNHYRDPSFLSVRLLRSSVGYGAYVGLASHILWKFTVKN